MDRAKEIRSFQWVNFSPTIYLSRIPIVHPYNDKHVLTIHCIRGIAYPGWQTYCNNTLVQVVNRNTPKLSVRTLGYYGNQTMVCMGGSPGLVVIGGDSCSEGHGFESQHCTLEGEFFTYICCKNCNIC